MFSFVSTFSLALSKLTAWPVTYDFCAALTLWIAFSSCAVILLTSRWHHSFTQDHLDEVQKIHIGEVPRIGGVAIIVALFFAGTYLSINSTYRTLLLICFAALPALAFGLAEDLTHRVSVRLRFWATLLAAVLGSFLLDRSLNSIGIEGIDLLLAYPLFALVLTAIACTGLAMSINIIDGLNGLSSFVSIAILLGLALLALEAGDKELFGIGVLGALAIAGFLVFNWPFGKLFLGDGGAYFIGFYIAWVAILLRARHPEISAFAMLLVCAYPIIETLFSMARRLKRKMLVGLPDQKHLHHWIYWHVKYTLKVKCSWVNSVAGLFTAILSVPPIVLTLQYAHDETALIESFIVMVGLYFALYGLLRGLARKKMKSATPYCAQSPIAKAYLNQYKD